MGLLTQDRAYTFHSQVASAPVYVEPVRFPTLELTLLLEGEIRFLIDGREHCVQGPAVTMSACRESLGVRVDARRTTRAMWCNCRDVSLSETEWRWLDSLPRALPMSDQLQQFFRSALQVPGHEARGDTDSFGGHIRNALGTAAFGEFFRQTGLRPPPASSRILAAKLYIDRHYSYACTIEDLAGLANMPPRRFVRMFEQQLGTTPARYLWEKRIEAGLRDLKTTDETVEEIAYRCGFQTAAHFSRRIKQVYGLSPRELRVQRHRI